MKFGEKELEVIVKMKRNGDFTVESNCRENYRVLQSLKAVVKSMEAEVNRQKGKLLLPTSHADQFGHFARN